LPEKPLFWQRTSGRSGEYSCKWVPVPERLYKEVGLYCVAAVIFSSSEKRGEFLLRDHDKFLYALAPPPFATGSFGHLIEDVFSFEVLPPMREAEAMGFAERTQEGLSLALTKGLDITFALSSILVAVGEQFSQGSNAGPSAILSRPRAIPRLAKGMAKSKLARRQPLPRDLWNLKAVLSSGMDSAVLREKIKHYWGRYPLQLYGSAEVPAAAVQTWGYKGMTFLPSVAFCEFIPDEEQLKSRRDRSYRPSTMLLNEVEPGQRYEVVFTSLQGGPFVRYRVGDMVEVAASRDEELNISLPQIVFDTRVDGIIDIGGFCRLTEKTIWQAIENSGVAYQGWTARKEVIEGQPVLHIYMELKGRDRTADEVRLAVHQSLKETSSDWADLEDMLGWQPLRVTMLPRGAFGRYISDQQAAGAELAHLKPPQINVPDGIVNRLLKV